MVKTRPVLQITNGLDGFVLQHGGHTQQSSVRLQHGFLGSVAVET